MAATQVSSGNFKRLAKGTLAEAAGAFSVHARKYVIYSSMFRKNKNMVCLNKFTVKRFVVMIVCLNKFIVIYLYDGLSQQVHREIICLYDSLSQQVHCETICLYDSLRKNHHYNCKF